MPANTPSKARRGTGRGDAEVRRPETHSGAPSGPSVDPEPGAQYPLEALEELRVRKRLGEDVGKLERGVDLDEEVITPTSLSAQDIDIDTHTPRFPPLDFL